MAEIPNENGGQFQKRASSKRSESGWFRQMMFGDEQDRLVRPIVSHEEVFALLEYAASHGIKKSIIKSLSQEIHKPEPDPSEVAESYAALVAATKPVNGRTLINSRDQGFQRLGGITVVTAIFFALAIGNSIIDNWIADIVEPEGGSLWLDLKWYVWDSLTPFFYGALGSCVFLMKAVQDSAKDNIYDHHYNQGWGTRVLIGGILAAIVLIIFDPASMSAESLPLSSAAIAFLTGLGVKPVYGALEITIEGLSDRLNLASIRRVPIADRPWRRTQERNGDDGD